MPLQTSVLRHELRRGTWSAAYIHQCGHSHLYNLLHTKHLRSDGGHMFWIQIVILYAQTLGSWTICFLSVRLSFIIANERKHTNYKVMLILNELTDSPQNLSGDP